MVILRNPEDHFSIDRLSQLSRTPSSVFALAFTPSRSSPRGRQPSLEVVTSPTTPTWQDPPQHPRLAVVLGIDPRYRHPLLACRSLCFCPSIWGTFKCIAAVWQVFDRRKDNVEFGCVATELWLAILWCCLSAHFSFLFIDSMMSRWLIHYTPWATLVRLVSICTINVYITSWILTLAGTTMNPRMLLPAWIFIACVLITAYYITQRNIKVVRRSMYQSMAMFVASACFVSMLVLLVELHTCTADIGLARAVHKVQQDPAD